jgi:hypothetical protein
MQVISSIPYSLITRNNKKPFTYVVPYIRWLSTKINIADLFKASQQVSITQFQGPYHWPCIHRESGHHQLSHPSPPMTVKKATCPTGDSHELLPACQPTLGEYQEEQEAKSSTSQQNSPITDQTVKNDQASKRNKKRCTKEKKTYETRIIILARQTLAEERAEQ